jgi:hypothetical protein
MGNQQIEYEIDKRIKSELWDLEIAKKVNKKYYIYRLKNNIKIVSFILLICLSIWGFVHRNDQKEEQLEILTNLYYQYHFPIGHYLYYEE